ncbi:MAG: Gfo/Idh/MocA family oxidoreductase [Fimbriimonadaceae bacterium]|nr:Gfo/Idh/MocA family oxidoreductase [Fimbriimonadaceae bacterium]
MSSSLQRRDFLVAAGLGAATAAAGQAPAIAGFEKVKEDPTKARVWVPFSDRKLKVGIVGYGVCRFGAQFGFQDHPSVEVVAVSDLLPDRCAELAKVCRCAQTYPSLAELVTDDRIEAVFVATDAPSHGQHVLEVLRHGKHVACAVPAVFGSLEEADALYQAVKTSGLKYMLFETSAFHDDLHAMRTLYGAGALGELVYAEGEYYHYMSTPIDSYRGWRVGLPPQWYPTHSNAYHVCVGGGHFKAVSCLGMKCGIDQFQPAANPYRNPFATEIALFQTSGGGAARMAVSWATPGHEGEKGRIRCTKGTYEGTWSANLPDGLDLRKPALPPGVEAGGHGGSHGHLGNEFVMACLLDRQPLVDIAWALNMTVGGIVAHQSALRDGELLKIPTYRWPAT